MLLRHAHEAGLPQLRHARFVDSLTLAKLVRPDLPSRALEKLYNEFIKAPLVGAHRAKADCLATRAVLEHLLLQHPPRGVAELPGAGRGGAGRRATPCDATCTLRCAAQRVLHGCTAATQAAAPRCQHASPLLTRPCPLPAANRRVPAADFGARLHAAATSLDALGQDAPWCGWVDAISLLDQPSAPAPRRGRRKPAGAALPGPESLMARVLAASEAARAATAAAAAAGGQVELEEDLQAEVMAQSSPDPLALAEAADAEQTSVEDRWGRRGCRACPGLAPGSAARRARRPGAAPTAPPTPTCPASQAGARRGGAVGLAGNPGGPAPAVLPPHPAAGGPQGRAHAHASRVRGWGRGPHEAGCRAAGWVEPWRAGNAAGILQGRAPLPAVPCPALLRRVRFGSAHTGVLASALHSPAPARPRQEAGGRGHRQPGPAAVPLPAPLAGGAAGRAARAAGRRPEAAGAAGRALPG